MPLLSIDLSSALPLSDAWKRWAAATSSNSCSCLVYCSSLEGAGASICTSLSSRASISLPSPYSEELAYTSTLTLPARRSSTSFLNSRAPWPLGVVSAVIWENLIRIGAVGCDSAAWADNAPIKAQPATIPTRPRRTNEDVMEELLLFLSEPRVLDSPDWPDSTPPSPLPDIHIWTSTPSAFTKAARNPYLPTRYCTGARATASPSAKGCPGCAPPLSARDAPRDRAVGSPVHPGLADRCAPPGPATRRRPCRYGSSGRWPRSCAPGYAGARPHPGCAPNAAAGCAARRPAAGR